MSNVPWGPIDSVPQDGTTVLLWLGSEYDRPELAYWNWRLECWVTPDEMGEIGRLVPTHWCHVLPPNSAQARTAA